MSLQKILTLARLLVTLGSQALGARDAPSTGMGDRQRPTATLCSLKARRRSSMGCSLQTEGNTLNLTLPVAPPFFIQSAHLHNPNWAHVGR